jgi:AAA domain
MDKGAHFHKCDFQVHSPRDLSWSGPRPVDAVDRRKFAEGLIAACRAKGLEAIAITDHHDLAFFRYIKEAAATETDKEGRPIPEDQRIVVFPGMELTLGLPCQALLILDADFPVGLLSNLNTVLASPCNPPDDPTHAQVARLEHFKSFDDLCTCLSQQDYLRDRYILLPNVSEGGNATLLRSGFASHYKSMACVGGYVDGSISQYGTGTHDIINGKNREYGNKAIGVFQTSDNRTATFADLGMHASWVKWAIPTAEALRQACLAKSTRISHHEPELPPLVLDFLDVSNSKFLGPFSIEFNPQFNCLIGGRGTGKSTILEYVRWALCDQPPSPADLDEVSDFQSKRATLIEKTLLPFDAVVTVGFRVNNVPHAVRRNARTKELLLKIDSSPFAKCTEDGVRDLLPIRAYSQKQLSAVGVRTEELVRFIQAPIQQHLTDINSRESAVKAKIRTVYGIMQWK